MLSERDRELQANPAETRSKRQRRATAREAKWVPTKLPKVVYKGSKHVVWRSSADASVLAIKVAVKPKGTTTTRSFRFVKLHA